MGLSNIFKKGRLSKVYLFFMQKYGIIKEKNGDLIMLRIELKKKNKNDNKSAKGSFEYITRSGLSNKDEIAKSTDLIYTSSKIPTFFSKENQFWNEVDKNERKNGRVNSELLISLPREKTTEEKVEMIEEFIENTLKKNTSYSYAIHEPLASDGLTNPHCHLMIYEKVFPRNFYNDELSKNITKKDFANTFSKNGNYIEKEKSYREKAFIYKARENYEELVYEKGDLNTQKQIEKFAKLNKKSKNKDNEKRFFILQSEQTLMKEKGEIYMNDFYNLKNSNSVNEIKEYFESVSEEKMKELNKLFPEQKDFFEIMKNENIDNINEKHNMSNEIILQTIHDITLQKSPSNLIATNSDLISLNKNIRNSMDIDDITNKYIYDKLVTKVFKDDNFDLENNRFFQLNKYFKELKENEENRLEASNYISNTTLEYRKNENDITIIDELPYKKINVKEIDLEKLELDCIKIEDNFNKKEEELFKNKELTNDLRLMYFTDLTKNIDPDDLKISFNEFMKNLKDNIQYNYQNLTKDFVYTDLFFKPNTNYFVEYDKNEINPDYLSMHTTTKNIRSKEFELKNEIIETSLNEVAKKENISLEENEKFFKDRKDFVELIKNNIKGNITYFNKVGNIDESMFFFKAIEDRENIIRTNLGNENLDFKISIKIPKERKKEESFDINNYLEKREISFQNFLTEKKEIDKAKLELGLSSTIYEKKEKSQTESETFRKNLRPTLPLMKVKLYLIPDDDTKNNLRMFKLDNNNDLLNVGLDFQGRNPSLLLNTPSVLEMAYKHSKDLSKDINLEKDISNSLEKSIETNSSNQKVFSKMKLKENIKNCFVDDNINKMITKNNGLHYKLTKNIADKILDKNMAFTALQNEYNLKDSIGKLVTEKGAYTFFGFSEDIEKMNNSLKKHYFIKSERENLVDKTVQSTNNINCIINFNNLEETTNISNVEKINSFFNLTTIGSDNLKSFITPNQEIEKKLINDFYLKKENEQIQTIIKDKINSGKTSKIPFYKEEKLEKEKESYFFDKNIEMLSLQYYVSTVNLSENEDEDPALDGINNLAKLSLSNMKQYVNSRPRRKEDEVKIDNRRIERYNIERESIISRKQETEKEYLTATDNINLNQYLSTLNFVKFKLEWEKENEEDEDKEEKEFSLIIKPAELTEKNSDYLFNDERMFDKNLIFKIYITNNGIDKQLDINTLNDNIKDGTPEEIKNIATDNIIKEYFRTRLIDKSDNPEQWTDSECDEIKNKLDIKLEYEIEKITKDQSLENSIKEFVAHNEVFQKIRINIDTDVEIQTSINNLQNTLLGQKLANELQKHIYSENDYVLEIYKYKNQNMKSLLEVNELQEDELTIKRKIKEIDYFNKNHDLFKAINDYSIDTDDDKVIANFNSKNKDIKVKKDIRFVKEYSNLDFDIQPKSYELEKDDFKNNFEIVKNNSKKMKLLKEVEKAL